MDHLTAALFILALTRYTSARAISNDMSSVAHPTDASTHHRLAPSDGQQPMLSNVASDISVGSDSVASASPPRPAILTISHTELPRVPSLAKCLELYQKLLEHDPHLFDLARCPVNGKSAMADALSRCQESHPSEDPHEQEELEGLILDFHRLMQDDCERGKQFLRDNHPLRDALHWLAGLTGAAAAGYTYKCRKSVQDLFNRRRKRRPLLPAGIRLTDDGDDRSAGESSDDDRSDDELRHGW
jgi:hypothetical protein